jgi:hypothetical protein
MKSKRTPAERQARKHPKSRKSRKHTPAAKRPAAGSPEIGTPQSVRIHTIGPEEKISLQPSLYTRLRVEGFRAGYEAAAQKIGGRPRIFDDTLRDELAAKLKVKLQSEGKPKKQAICIGWVREWIEELGRTPPEDDHRIERDIVRPAYRELGWSRPRKQTGRT